MSIDLKFLDITDKCKYIASKLDAKNPMIYKQDDSFSLYDSMTAIEIMDPKMDQCSSLNIPSSMDLMFSLDLKKLEKLDTSVTISLIKSFFADEVIFLKGYSLMESVFRNKLFWSQTWSQLENNTHPYINLLLNFAKCSHSSIDDMFSIALGPDLYEDEDFHPQFRECLVRMDTSIEKETLLSNTNDDNSISVAKNLLEDVVEENSISMAIQNIKLNESAEEDERNIEISFLELLVSLKNDFNSLLRLINDQIKGNIRRGSSLLKIEDRKSFKESIEDLNDLNKNILIVKTKSNKIYHSYFIDKKDQLNQLDRFDENFGVSSLKDSIFEELDGDHLTRLMQNNPLRAVPNKSFSDAMNFLESLAIDVEKACNLMLRLLQFELDKLGSKQTEPKVSEADHDDRVADPDKEKLTLNSNLEEINDSDMETRQQFGLTIDEMLITMVEFSTENNSHLISRSYLYSIFHSLIGNIPAFIKNSMQKWGVPTSFINTQIVSEDWIFGNPCSAFLETLRVLCVCRGRVFNKMENVLSLWGNASTESYFIDEHYRREPPSELLVKAQEENDALSNDFIFPWISSWMGVQVCQVINLFFEILTESDILHPFEIAYTYWYWDYVLSSFSTAVDKLRDMKIKFEHLKSFVANGSDTKYSQFDQHSYLTPHQAELTLRGKSQLCKCIYRVAVILMELGHIKKYKNELCSIQTIFDQRFQYLKPIAFPQVLVYNEFEKTITMKGKKPSKSDLEVILNGSKVCLQNSRKIFDEIKKIDPHKVPHSVVGLLKFSVSLGISLAKFTSLFSQDKVGAYDSALPINLSFSRKYFSFYPDLVV